jgi:hypothetical protein
MFIFGIADGLITSFDQDPLFTNTARAHLIFVPLVLAVMFVGGMLFDD